MVTRTVILTNSVSSKFPVNELCPILSIDLTALSHNYVALQKKSGTAKLATVVKADAYGLGIDNIVPVLKAAGCESFLSLPLMKPPHLEQSQMITTYIL